MKTTQQILNEIRLDESGNPIAVVESSQQALNAVYDPDNHALRVKNIGGGESGAVSNWHAITAFTATPASTSTITMTADLTGTVPAGAGLEYTIGGTEYFGIITAITSNLLTIAGAPLSGDLTELYWTHIPIIEEPFDMDGYFADASDTQLLLHDVPLNVPWTWEGNPAYLVRYKQSTTNNDSGATTQPTVQIMIGGNAVLTTPLTIPNAVSNETTVQIVPAYYRIKKGDILELSVTAAGGGTPAHDSYFLQSRFFFVPEVV